MISNNPGMVRIPAIIYLLIFLFIGYVPLKGQEDKYEKFYPPRAPLPRYLDDYSELDTLDRKNVYLKLKYVPVSTSSHVSFGGEIKQSFEYFNNYRLGLADQDPNGYLLWRNLIHLDFHHKDWFRVYTQFNYTDISWRDTGPRGLDRDRFAIHQLFLELSYKINNAQIQLRAGRREYSYGRRRWMDSREGPNTRLSFDGASLKVTSKMDLEFFFLAPVKNPPSFFDNRTAWNKKRIGFHATADQWIPRNEFNFYGLYFESPDPLPLMGYAAQKAAFGIRDKVVWPVMEIDGEFMFQLAMPDDTVTRAMMLAMDFRFRPVHTFQNLKMGLDFLYTSGKRNPRSMTFQSLHPSNKNTRNNDLFGKHNLTYMEPYVQITPTRKDLIEIESFFYLKSSSLDNVYTIPGSVLYDHNVYDGSFLGTQIGLVYTRFWNPFLQTMIAYQRFFTSGQLQQQTASENLDFVNASLTIRF